MKILHHHKEAPFVLSQEPDLGDNSHPIVRLDIDFLPLQVPLEELYDITPTHGRFFISSYSFRKRNLGILISAEFHIPLLNHGHM